MWTLNPTYSNSPLRSKKIRKMMIACPWVTQIQWINQLLKRMIHPLYLDRLPNILYSNKKNLKSRQIHYSAVNLKQIVYSSQWWLQITLQPICLASRNLKMKNWKLKILCSLKLQIHHQVHLTIQFRQMELHCLGSLLRIILLDRILNLVCFSLLNSSHHYFKSRMNLQSRPSLM